MVKAKSQLRLVGKKIGMCSFFDKKGLPVPCTAIQALPHAIVQVKTKERDGYAAIQVGAFKEAKLKGVSRPLRGHFAKAGVEPHRYLLETRIQEGEEFQVGGQLALDAFAECKFVDVQGMTKGKGHQGVIKRHNFQGGPAAHGSGFHRHGGSCGMRSTPGRCLPGQKKSGRMGGEQFTVQNLEVVKVDVDKGILLVRGAVPGPTGAVVVLQSAKKKHHVA